jgi:putative nucleotidyltransferase-like protein
VGDATRVYFLGVFSETLEILESNDIAHLVIGSIANVVHFGDAWEPRSDIDLLVSQDDAGRCLEIFPAHGYATHVRDPSWIYKIAKPNVTIDLIFKSADRIEMGPDILERSELRQFEGLTLRVPSVEDMAVHFVLMDTDERQGHWYDAMRYFRVVTDWEYLINRGRQLAPRKFLAALLYAQEIGIKIPDDPIRWVASAIG